MKGSAVTEQIRRRLCILYFIVTFVLVSLLLLNMRHLYKPANEFLDFLPELSITVIIISNLFLAIAGFYLSAVLSKQVLRRIDDYSNRLNSILTVMKSIREEVHSDLLLEKILDYCISLTRSEAGVLMLNEGGSLVIKATKGVGEMKGRTVSGKRGACLWSLRLGEPVIINDVTADDRYNPDVDLMIGTESSGSILCIPLKTKKGHLGVIEVMNRSREAYGEADIEIIKYLADQAAISIERASFYEDQKNFEIHITDILLDTIDRFLPEKQGHSRRVAKYANMIAKALDLPDERRRRLYMASLLHDIGFLRIPYERSFEREYYTLHPITGYEMLRPISFYSDIAPHILYHHERYDGGGYPENRKAEEIPLESRIIAIAEAFDSMVSKITYKSRRSMDEAIDELIVNRGKQFDPELVDIFVKNIREPLE